MVAERQPAAPPATGTTLVLALGNPLRGDDGLGAAVLEELRRSVPPAAPVDLVDGGSAGLETALLLHGYRRAIIVDAAEMQLRPGEWRRLAADGGQLMSGDLSSAQTLHGAGLAEALELGEALGILPETIEVFAVQPLQVGWTPGLSRPVQDSLPAVAQAILNTLSRPAAE